MRYGKCQHPPAEASLTRSGQRADRVEHVPQLRVAGGICAATHIVIAWPFHLSHCLQVCAARGLLPKQSSGKIILAFEPNRLWLDGSHGSPRLGSCSGYHQRVCHPQLDYANDVRHLQSNRIYIAVIVVAVTFMSCSAGRLLPGSLHLQQNLCQR